MLCGVLVAPLLFDPPSPDDETKPIIDKSAPPVHDKDNNNQVIKELEEKDENKPTTQKTELPVQDRRHSISSELEQSCCCSTCCCSLMRNVNFVILTVNLTLFAAVYLVVFTFLPLHAVDVGIDKALVSVIGISYSCSRLIGGYIGNNSAAVRFYLTWACIVCFSITASCIIFYRSYTAFCIACVILGVCSGCVMGLFPVLVMDFVDVELQEIALGKVLFFMSFGFLCAPPISGMIIEWSDKVDLPFVMWGCISAVGSLSFVPVTLSIYYSKKK